MILTDKQIEELVNKQGMIFPFERENLNPQSLDVRLGNVFTKVVAAKGYKAIIPSQPKSIHNISWTNSRVVLKPGDFILATLKEVVDLPPDICATVMGRSSLGRLGLSNSHVAGFIDGGFRGTITLELFNHSRNTIILYEGDKIGQLLFERTLVPRESYRDKKKSKYLDQAAGEGSKGI